MGKAYEGGSPLVEVVRSGYTEGLHRGSVVVLDADGGVVAAAGDVSGAVFPRSSSKPLQAVAMLRSGLRLADPADLALVCASHWGEDFHVSRVRALLRSAGLDEAALRCPPALPHSEAATAALFAAGGGRARVYMDCSGKHAGMLLTCRENGWPLEEYYDREHPLQERITATVAEFAGEEPVATGVDGCGAPVLAVSLTALGRAYLRLVHGEESTVERRVADAMRAHPELVGGTGAEDTVCMRGVPGLLCKVGAEAVWVAAVPRVGAVALKIDDGGNRARPPVLVSALRRLGVRADVLDRYAEPPLTGGTAVVGGLRAVW
ncbi:MAG TPA: asparaginase [Pilimelia sp.]|nr:asparaginase [Pilimelia sp.]